MLSAGHSKLPGVAQASYVDAELEQGKIAHKCSDERECPNIRVKGLQVCLSQHPANIARKLRARKGAI